VKTHLPVDALVFAEQAKYIYIGRDGRDVVWSMYNHHANANEAWYEALNDTPGRVGPPIEKPPASIKQYFNEWLDNDGHPWWAIRHLPNVLFIRFSDLKRDMPGEIRRVAAFLETPIDEDKWESILLHCSFDYMKANATKSVPLGGGVLGRRSTTFIHKGKNDRWRDTLDQDQVQRYERRCLEELGPECARWLATGGPF